MSNLKPYLDDWTSKNKIHVDFHRLLGDLDNNQWELSKIYQTKI